MAGLRATIAASLILAPCLAVGAGSARDFIKLEHVFSADCMMHSARLVTIRNTHMSKSIRVVLYRYTGETRSQGRSVKLLRAHDEPRALGCDATSGLDRRWVIQSADFVRELPATP